MLGAEVSPELLDAFLNVDGEVPLVDQQVIVLDQFIHRRILLINVLESLIGTILADILTRENKSVVVCGLQRYRIMAVINHGQSKLLEVANESCKDLAAWHVKSRLVVVFCKQNS